MPPSRNFHKQGAEGIVYLASELGQDVAIKHRFKKAYRLPELDTMLTSSRLKQEVRSILRARRLGVRAPVICRVDLERSCIVMHKIEGKTVKDAFLRDGLAKERKHKIATELGRMVAVLHDGDLIHGDMSTVTSSRAPRRMEAIRHGQGWLATGGGTGTSHSHAGCCHEVPSSTGTGRADSGYR